MNSKLSHTSIVVLAVLHVLSGCQRQQAFKEIQESHIQANVPEDSSFMNYLTRDVSAYLKKEYGKACRINIEFLRQGATQSGVAYPKFYLWIIATDTLKNSLFTEGAMRAAAIEKEGFEVTHFISKGTVRAGKDTIYQIFPAPVCERIEKKVFGGYE